MTASLAQLLVLLVRDGRAVHINRNLPSECVVQTVVLRRRRQVLVTADYMGDLL